jgi:5,10-methylenetetrahydrofolate reductase
MKTFRKALQGTGFSLTAELQLPDRIPLREILRRASLLAPTVDGIMVDERSQSCGGIAPLALATLLLREGIDPITGINCRDRNRIALQSDLLGLRALGVSSLILESGDHASRSGTNGGKRIKDTNCRELIAMAQAMTEEEWPHGQHEFLIGTRVSAVALLDDRSLERLTARAAAGARFLQVRHCSDPVLLRDFLQALVEVRLTWSYGVIVTLAPHAQRLNTLALAEHMQNMSELPGVSGLHFQVRDDPETVAEAVEASGLGSGQRADQRPTEKTRETKIADKN